jgi:hypothetical protein
LPFVLTFIVSVLTICYKPYLQQYYASSTAGRITNIINFCNPDLAGLCHGKRSEVEPSGPRPIVISSAVENITTFIFMLN